MLHARALRCGVRPLHGRARGEEAEGEDTVPHPETYRP